MGFLTGLLGVGGGSLIGGLAGALPGSRLASGIDNQRLQRIFAGFTLAVAAFVVVQVAVPGGVAA